MIPILDAYAPLIKAAAVVAVLAGVAGYSYHAGSSSKQAQWDLADRRRSEADSAAWRVASERTRTTEAAAASALSKIDLQHEALRHAQDDNETLRRQLAAGIVRVRLAAAADAGSSSPSAGAASLGDGKAGCELNTETAQSLAGIAEDGDRAIRKLTALQAYVTDVVMPTCGAL